MKRDWPLKSSNVFSSDEAPPTRSDGSLPAADSTTAPLGEPSYLRVFHRLRARLVANTTEQVLRQAPLRIITILLCSGLIWWVVFAISTAGLSYLRSKHIYLSGDLIGLVFTVLFLALTMLLIFSTGIILYSSLFSSHE